MGYQISKLERKVARGDEPAALEIFKTLPRKTRRRLNSNKSLGFPYEYHTLLHLAALRGMPNLLRVLLEDFSGDSNWLNNSMETSLNVACTRGREIKQDCLERHEACVKILLEWKGRMIQGQEDKVGDTAMHLAAADGLIGCVEELIKTGVSPFGANNENWTPRGLARVLGYYCTAFMLDTIMTLDKEVQDDERSNLRMREDDEACFSFDFKMLTELITGDFEDMLTLRTIDEVLEKNNSGKIFLITEYYRERLTIKWTSDLVECFKLAGIPISRYRGGLQQRSRMDVLDPADERLVVCPLCASTVQASSRPPVQMKCCHNFCSSCWKKYLTEKIEQECQISILCPIYNCKVVLPNHVVESLVSRDLVRKYRSLKLMTLINSGNFIKWCPTTDCGLAVRLSVPKYWQKVYEPLEQMGLTPSRAVECGNGHYFCWECLDTCHAPMPCDQWQMWLKRVSEHDPAIIPDKVKDCAEAVNHLWIAENSKLCPMCNAPTQENDGCKFLSCTQCDYEFRYVCLGVCEIKPTLTGGLVECIIPNQNQPSLGGGHIGSKTGEDGSAVAEASASGHTSSNRGEEGSDVAEASTSGHTGSDKQEEGSNVAEASTTGHTGCTKHKECSDVAEASKNGHTSSNKQEEGSDVTEASTNGHTGSNKQEEGSDVDEASGNGHTGSNKQEEGSDVDEALTSGYTGWTRHEECSDVAEASTSGYTGCTKHKEISEIAEAATSGYMGWTRHEGSDTDEVFRSGYVGWNRHEEGSDVDEACTSRHISSSEQEEGSDVDEAFTSRHISSSEQEEGSDVDEACTRRHISSKRHEEGSDVDEASTSGHISSNRLEEGSDVDEPVVHGHVEYVKRRGYCDGAEGREVYFSGRSNANRRRRGKYILILHKEYSSVDEILKGGYYEFNKSDDGYTMIDKLRDKYFKCVRHEELCETDEAVEKLWAEAIMRTQERRGLRKFHRYYLKYTEMLKVLEREKYYFKVISDRVECIKRVLILRKDSPEKGKEKAKFLIDGMLELLRLRETLASSYGYAFYLDEMGFNTEQLCRLQRELESLIKKMMNMIVMPQNRKPGDVPPRSDVIHLTVVCRRTRYSFMRMVINSLYKQDIFAAIKNEKRKFSNQNFGYEDEGGNEANRYSVVSSAGAEGQSGTVQGEKSLDSTVDPEVATNETLSDSEVGPGEARGYDRPQAKNPKKRKVNRFCPKCMPRNIQNLSFYMSPWRRVKIREKVPHATAGGMEIRNAPYLSFVSRAPQGVSNANGAAALSIQQQKTDVGVTIGNVIQEADAEKSAHHLKTNGDLKDELVFDNSFANGFQGVAEDKFSHGTEDILGEEVDSLKFDQVEEGGEEASFSTGNSTEQLAGDPETNTHLNFDFEEKEEATEQSPKPF